MTAVFVASGLSFGAWGGNLPGLREAAGLDDAHLGMVLLCVSLGAVGAMQVAGRYAAVIGLVRSCWLGGLALAAVMPWPGVVPGWWPLVVSAAVLGFGMGWLDVCMNAHAAGMERRWGEAIMSSFHAGWSLGQLLGAALAGVLASAGLGLAASLAAAGGLIALVSLSGLLLRPGDERPEPVRFVAPNRAMLALCAIIGLSFAIEGATADWSGVYLRVELGASTASAATGLGVFAGTMVVFRLIGDRIVRWLGPRRVVTMGGLISAAGLALALSAPAMQIAAVGFALVGVGLANVVPVIFSAAGRDGPAGVAMVSTAGYSGIMLAPPLIGFVSNGFGLPAGLGLVLLGGLVIAALGRRF